ncbi:DUF6755 family protein [Allorhodopirellula solitaria]|uniref:DUF6755 family protein n=1 Tax=Allorhodopirellula solitaria TaxID=2527987 RepID=UPI0037048091
MKERRHEIDLVPAGSSPCGYPRFDCDGNTRWLGGDESVVWPAAIASTICLGLNLGLMWYLTALDRK